MKGLDFLMLPKFRIGIVLTVIATNLASGQQNTVNKPEHEIERPIRTVVKAKESSTANPNWNVYSDSEMNKKLGSIAVGDSAMVIGWATWLYFIKSKELSGYISWRSLEVNNLTGVLVRESRIADELQTKKQEELEKRNHEQLLIRKFGKPAAQKILDGEYWIGMTSEMTTYSLGQPETKNNNVSANSIREQWVYRKHKIAYLYFTNGILTSYQD